MKSGLKYIALVALCSLLLQSCSSNASDERNAMTNSAQNTEIKSVDISVDTLNIPEQNIDIEETTAPRDAERKVIIPDLPSKAQTIDAFIVNDWILMDSIDLDFNNDGRMDLIGVLEHEIIEEVDDKSFYPRILFAIASTSDGYYELDFQDINLIRTRDEGGVFGDPFEPLTSENNSFTIHAYGGSAWRWQGAMTFRYINNDWFLINEEATYGYGSLLSQYEKYDYESGVGFVAYNNEDFDCIENIWSDGEVFDTLEKADFDLSFCVEVESPITLMQASQRWWLASDRLETVAMNSINVTDGIDLNKADIPKAIEISSINNPIRFMDENYILFTFYSADKSKEYLCVYDKHNKTSVVVAQTYMIKEGEFKDDFSDAKICNGTIYYEELIYNKIKNDRNGVVTENLEHTASRLMKLNIDGNGGEAVFLYNFLDENKTILNWAPYCDLGFSFVKEGILICLYNGDKDTQYYLIGLDGSDTRFLGLVRGTPSRWLGDFSLVGRIGESLDIHMKLDLRNGKVEGSYYYDKYGEEINLNGYLSRCNLELYEEGGTGRMYGLIVDNMIKGAWTDGERVLPIAMTIEGAGMANVYEPGEDLLKFKGVYEGKNSTDKGGSSIEIHPIFDDLAYIEFFAYANTIMSVNTGAFCGIAVFDNGGLSYQSNGKTYEDNQTAVFRLTTEENGDMLLYTNDYRYNCGVGASYDFIYKSFFE